jgi:stalled ribosome rescue protein Dom34
MTNVNAKPADIQHAHAVVWIDHLTAKIFPMGQAGVGEVVVHAHPSSSHLHHKANSIGSGHAGDDKHFLPAVAEALRFCREVLIVGPGTEKSKLLHYLKDTRKDLSDTQLHAEAADHPTDREIIALGRRRFGLD